MALSRQQACPSGCVLQDLASSRPLMGAMIATRTERSSKMARHSWWEAPGTTQDMPKTRVPTEFDGTPNQHRFLLESEGPDFWKPIISGKKCEG